MAKDRYFIQSDNNVAELENELEFFTTLKMHTIVAKEFGDSVDNFGTIEKQFANNSDYSVDVNGYKFIKLTTMF